MVVSNPFEQEYRKRMLGDFPRMGLDMDMDIDHEKESMRRRRQHDEWYERQMMGRMQHIRVPLPNQVMAFNSGVESMPASIPDQCLSLNPETGRYSADKDLCEIRRLRSMLEEKDQKRKSDIKNLISYFYKR